jgi:hypothetical protein
VKIIYTERAKQFAEDREFLQQANNRLRDVLGPSGDLVTATWDRELDQRDRVYYALTVQDFTGAVSTKFAPDELRNADHLQVRLYRLWGDLLQVRSDEQHRKVQQLVGDLKED